jgi:CRP/FNR family transcriptional regulator
MPECPVCSGGDPAREVRLGRREILHTEGEAADAMYAVQQGFLRETRETPSGKLQAVRLVFPGDIVGTEALVRAEYQSNVEAVTASRLCRLPIDLVRDTVLRESSRALALSEALCRHEIALRDSTLLLGSMTAEERVMSFIHRVTSGTVPGCWTDLPLTRQDLGDFLGLALGTVSRTLHRLARAGALEVDGRRVRLPRG